LSMKPQLLISTSFPYTTLFRSGLDVDARERLVEQDDASVLGQGTGKENPFLLAAGQFADLALAEIGHADPGQRRGHRLAVGRFRSEEHTSELQSREKLVCRLLL